MAKGTVVAETDAIRVVHNVTIVTFDGAKAIVDGAEYGIASMVVDSIGVKGGLADNVIAAILCCAIEGVVAGTIVAATSILC